MLPANPSSLSSTLPASQGAQRPPLHEELSSAARVIVEFDAGKDLESVLAGETSSHTGGQMSSTAIKEFVYRVVRLGTTLARVLDQLNQRLPQPFILALQKVVVAQLMQTSSDDLKAQSRLVAQAVEAVKAKPDFAFAAGFLNATLRRFLREQATLLIEARRTPEGLHNHPQWWIDQLKLDHPQHWQQIIFAANSHAPMTLRVNSRAGDASAYLQQLQNLSPPIAAHMESLHIAAQPQTTAVILQKPIAPYLLPGFAQGAVSVQDLGAQLAAPLLDLKDGMRVLDACAAPGGKTVHCLELADIHMLALDLDETRLAKVAENISRYRAGLALSSAKPPQITLKAADARVPKTWWDGQLFDRILADVPCSASGIVRRHPDIRWRRQRGDLATFFRQQLEMLNCLWPVLKPGGKLLYVTCSVFRAEGDEVIAQFLKERPLAQRDPLQSTWLAPDGYALPASKNADGEGANWPHDGFFYARLTKTFT